MRNSEYLKNAYAVPQQNNFTNNNNPKQNANSKARSQSTMKKTPADVLVNQPSR
jgi:hypothetical protein